MPAEPQSAADLAIQAASPALWAALSPRGRAAQVPENFLPQQSAAARGKTWNATIGQITDGRGGALPLSPIAAALAGLDPALRNQALLYSPVEGSAELRRLWREHQRRGRPEAPPSSLPLVTAGPVLALSLAAGLFISEGQTVLLAGPAEAPEIPETPEIFTLRTGASAKPCSLEELRAALASTGPGEPVVVVLCPPHGLGQRSPLIDTLTQAAGRGPLVVVLDETSLPQGSSLFWDLADRHPALLPVKVDGPGELGFPGSGVGFFTLALDPETEVAQAMEGKAKMLLRAEVGSPPALGQAVLSAALREEGEEGKA